MLMPNIGTIITTQSKITWLSQAIMLARYISFFNVQESIELFHYYAKYG
jgi:hypothetical protein